MLTSDQKGSIAEMAIAYNAIKLGVEVYRPLSDGTRYDLIFDAFPQSSQIQLRLSPPLNNQRACTNWADDFAFEARLGRSGAIAQLGERLHGMQEVAGSSPAGSTTVGAHEFRNHFGWFMERAAAGEEIAVTRRSKPYVRLCAALVAATR
jgi:prevent-host-death family protein